MRDRGSPGLKDHRRSFDSLRSLRMTLLSGRRFDFDRGWADTDFHAELDASRMWGHGHVYVSAVRTCPC